MSNRVVVSDVFSLLLEDKSYALEIYNSLNDKTYDDPNLVEICVLKRSISLSVKNDASFIVAMDLNMYEHQSTYNPNMPLRDLFYVTDVLKPTLSSKDLFGTKLIKIPTPHFVVFYNGLTKRPAKEIFKLSDAFENPTNTPELELIVTCYNINPGNNEDFMNKCSVLSNYMIFVNKIREYRSIDNDEDNIEDSVDKAIHYCIDNNILKDFFISHESEVKKFMVLDMTFEAREKLIKRDSYDDGYSEGISQGINQNRHDIAKKLLLSNSKLDFIMQITELSENEIENIAQNINIKINR